MSAVAAAAVKERAAADRDAAILYLSLLQPFCIKVCLRRLLKMYVLVRSRCVVTDFIFWLLWFCNTVVLSRGGFRIWPHSRQACFFFRYSIVCRSMVHRLWIVAGARRTTWCCSSILALCRRLRRKFCVERVSEEKGKKRKEGVQREKGKKRRKKIRGPRSLVGPDVPPWWSHVPDQKLLRSRCNTT